MTKNKVAVIGVLYPGVEPYIDNYIRSLENQTYKDFDVIFMNDGLRDVNSVVKTSELSISLHQANGTPSIIRFNLIKKILDSGYTHVVFTDCDDFFSENRIEICMLNLVENEIVVNDLDIVAEDSSFIKRLYLSDRINNKSEITSKDILSCNMMGLTNTATKSFILKEILPSLKVNVVAFDWLLWTYALSCGHKAIFTSDTSTKYRVYSDNVSGLPQKIGRKEVLHELAIKISHYKHLINLGVEHKKLYNRFLEVDKKSQDTNWFDNYILALEANKVKNPMWWENVRVL